MCVGFNIEFDSDLWGLAKTKQITKQTNIELQNERHSIIVDYLLMREKCLVNCRQSDVEGNQFAE